MRVVRTYVTLFQAIRHSLRQPRVQALILICLLLALAQAIVFMIVERWSFLDALYFSVVSMATVGYGDLVPVTALGKVFTIFFLIVSIGVFVLAVSTIAHAILRELMVVPSAGQGSSRPAPVSPVVEPALAGQPPNREVKPMLDQGYFDSTSSLSAFDGKDTYRPAQDDGVEEVSKRLLTAGRGSCDWTATRAREAFFLLGQFALTEAKRTYNDPVAGVAGMPPLEGAHARFTKWVKRRQVEQAVDVLDDDGPTAAEALANAVEFAITKFDFEPDAFMHELTDSIIGENYPVPNRALHHNEIVTQEYLMWAMCAGHRPDVKFDLYPVEGGAAAMCYVFKALKNQRLLNAGDTIALGTPIFPPYLEMPELEDYGLHVVRMSAEQEDKFQFTEDDVEALADPKVKALFLVNPGNPTAATMDPDSIRRLVKFVTERRPDLMILTDDIYGTFVPGFESIMGHLPRNTIGVYSYSKYFGCTGWRLGVIAVAQDNIFDERIQAHPEEMQQVIEQRYMALTPKPRDVKFIDRIVADSRDVALNYTAGLSLPQQVMMTLFGLVELMDEDKLYQKACIAICEKRTENLVDGTGI